MEAEPPSADSTAMKQKLDALHSLASGPLATAASKLHNHSRGVPSGKDFHFFNNFDKFKNPVKDIKDMSESSLRSVSSADGLWGIRKPPQLPDDDDEESIEWLININDELIERFSLSMDEFKNLREKEEVDGGKRAAMDLDGGFQMVYGKKKKETSLLNEKEEALAGSDNLITVNVVSKDKKTAVAHSRVPFHISSIPRPQSEYNILVNNNNEPFNHVWLEKSNDGFSYIHPLEKHSIMDFVDRNVDERDPVVPLPLEKTPFKLVEGVNELKELAAKLRAVNEFAVDLEHNQYRSFQGLTCLMQISTRTEDFIVDTLKLRIHVGPYLREIFKDPLKKKIMHGADRDIIWLQRDFGIYVCNLFDTGQASRVLQLERNSLEYLLHHFCGVNANKEYQNADWRLRPLPDQMIKYAREDTHYLLYIYDLMHRRLLSPSSDESDLLLEVYKRSAEICFQLYEKELLTDTSYLHIYGLPEAELNSQQLAIVAGLCQWRDNIARTEDESTGYILPNKTLIEIAKQMPLTSGKLRRLIRHKHPIVERYLNVVVEIIKASIANSAAFEEAADMLRKGRLETLSKNSMRAVNQDSIPTSGIDFSVQSTIAESVDGTKHSIGRAVDIPAATYSSVEPAATENLISSISSSTKVVQENNFISVTYPETACSTAPINISGKAGNEDTGSSKCMQSRKAFITSVQLLKKPTGAFGTLFGNSSSRKTTTMSQGSVTGKDYNKNKVEQIKSSVVLPFHNFSGEEPANSDPVDINHVPRGTSYDYHVDTVKMEDVILLEDEGNNGCSPSDSTMEDMKQHREETISQQKSDEKPISPSSLSFNFDKCFQSINQRRNSQQDANPSREPEINFQLKPFDYASARRSMKFGGAGADEGESKDDDELKTSPDNRKVQKALKSAQPSEERSKGAQPRRSQAFPPSGNRSMSYN